MPHTNGHSSSPVCADGEEPAPPLYRIEQDTRRDYTKLPHDGFAYAQVIGGELLTTCKDLIKERKQVIKKRDAYFKELTKFFKAEVVGNYGYCGHISDICLEVPLPKTLQRVGRKSYRDFSDKRKAFKSKYVSRFAYGKYGPWRVHTSYFAAVPLSAELAGVDDGDCDAVLRMLVRPHRNKTGGQKVARQLTELRIPQGNDLASRITTSNHQWVTRGPGLRGGILCDSPQMMTIGKHFILRLPISTKKPQPKHLFLLAGTALRLTMSEFWQIREQARE